MLKSGDVLKEFDMDDRGVGSNGSSGSIGGGVTITPKTSIGEATYSSIVINPIIMNEESRTQTQYLQRVLRVDIYNPATKQSYTFEGNKMTIAGTKYIGVQQDEFKIIFQNISYYDFGRIVNSGFKVIEVVLDDFTVFSGMIKTINTGRDSIVERTLEINCLRKVTDLLSDIVSPITVNSSMNVWAIMEDGLNLTFQTPTAFKDIKFDNNYTFSGYKKTVIDDIIKVVNDQLNRTTNSNLNWLEYTYEQDGTMNLFSPYVIDEILNIQPYTGLIDTPTVSEDSISFSSIFKQKLVPGRVVFMDNALFKTLGNTSAFIYAWDPDGLYVLTEVRYELSNYPNTYKVSCKARPFSKYNNFTASLEG